MPARAQGKKRLDSSGNEDLTLDANSFGIYLLEALKSQDVATALGNALKPVHEQLMIKMSAKYDAKIKKLEDELQSVKEELKEVKQKLNEADGVADDQEQYSRRTSVRISGITETQDENVAEKVQEVFREMHISPPAINRVHRVGPKTSDHSRQIICQFTTWPDKHRVMTNKQSIRRSNPNVYISEDLTRTRAKMAYLARMKKREGKITDTWTADGKIVIKDNSGKIHYVTRTHQIEKF